MEIVAYRGRINAVVGSCLLFSKFGGRCIHFKAVAVKFIERSGSVDNIIKKPFSSKTYDGKLEIISTANWKAHTPMLKDLPSRYRYVFGQ